MSPEPPLALHEHRLDHNRSKLPSFRIADVKAPKHPRGPTPRNTSTSNNIHHNNNTMTAQDDQHHQHSPIDSHDLVLHSRSIHDDTISPTNVSGIPQEHYAGPVNTGETGATTTSTTGTTGTTTGTTASTSAPHPPAPLLPDDSPPRSSNPDASTSLARPRTRTRSGGPQSPPFPSSSPSHTTTSTTSSPPSASALARARTHKPSRTHPVPASHSRNDVLGSGPPPAMITQKVSLQALDTENSTAIANSTSNPTKDWVADQSALTSPSADAGETASTGISNSNSSSNRNSNSNRTPSSSQPTTPLIPPIRGFRTSRRSTEAASRRVSMDQDDTLKAFEGFSAQRFLARDRDEQAEQNSDDSDLFLRLAREESAATARTVNRRSQPIQMNRQSLPPTSTIFQSSMDRRRGSDQGSALGEHVYRASREKPPTSLDPSRARYFAAISQSTPTTPRGFRMRETSPESQVSRSSRRPSIADPATSRASYRQSNLSQAFPRTFNSSPLVSRTADVQEGSDMPRAADGTESTVSTAAASTVWDELEDLKSRMRKLELTGKLPPTSSAAISRASNERPPTATTTVTTVSLSPKRVRNNSISPAESAVPTPGETHPLLTAALAKSRSLLTPEVYKALEATAADALTITSMMGTSGQPGPISSSQSTIGTPSGGVSDRQVRRKADSLCRSLTELTLALSEASQHDRAQAANKQTVRPRSRDTEASSVVDNVQRPPLSSELTRLKSSPRAPSRLEARRSSLLTGSALPSPRYGAPSEVTTPTQASVAGRRSSLLLRSRRAATEEPEEDDGGRFRTPSRAATDLGRVANSPREYTSQQALPESRLPTAQSSLPVRRHYVSTSLTNGSTPPLSAAPDLGARRYLDRSTPDRDTSSVVGRAAEARGLRKPSVGQIPVARTSSISRRARQSYSVDSPITPQAGSYQ